MKLPFGAATASEKLRQPKTAQFPEMRSGEVAALYRAARVGGDYFDFAKCGDKVIFVLMDVAGQRDHALHVAAAVQEVLHQRAPVLFKDGADEPAITGLSLELNRVVLDSAHGVCCAPAFLGCYDQEIHTVTYVNAGHTPGLLKDDRGTLDLQPNGIPFGLFSHSTHDAQFCALGPKAVLLLASKGLVETRSNGMEFGMNRLREALNASQGEHAISICREVIEAVERYEKGPQSATAKLAAAVPGLRPPEPNDVTTVALLRNSSNGI
jgi:serine phosphatase RsbU (regulator of sigma subunit)